MAGNGYGFAEGEVTHRVEILRLFSLAGVLTNQIDISWVWAETVQGNVLERAPSVDGGATVLDIVVLFDAIIKRGGLRRVREQSLWKEVRWDYMT